MTAKKHNVSMSLYYATCSGYESKQGIKESCETQVLYTYIWNYEIHKNKLQSVSQKKKKTSRRK
jgi:hypothetical protein